jgi:hypothetical protein
LKITLHNPNMCDPKDTKIFEVFDGCGHRLPKEVCNYYSNEYFQCYAAPNLAKKLPVYEWKDGKRYSEICKFCKEGKDIDGAYKYGEGWKGRELFR